jgi:hypothetical protein
MRLNVTVYVRCLSCFLIHSGTILLFHKLISSKVAVIMTKIDNDGIKIDNILMDL